MLSHLFHLAAVLLIHPCQPSSADFWAISKRIQRRVVPVQIIYCAAARTMVTADLVRVEERGVGNVVKAMQVGGGLAARGWQGRRPGLSA